MEPRLPFSGYRPNATITVVLAIAMALLCCGVWAAAAPTEADTEGQREASPVNWPQFRGPGALPVSDHPRLPKTWSATENVEWVAEIPGMGWSSPIVWDGKVFLTTASAPDMKQPSLGVDFSSPVMGPEFADGAFVGMHGSWNRPDPSGYKVVFVPFRNGRPAGDPIDFATGFRDDDGTTRGRPVGVTVDPRGAVIIADDLANIIWRVSRVGGPAVVPDAPVDGADADASATGESPADAATPDAPATGT